MKKIVFLMAVMAMLNQALAEKTIRWNLATTWGSTVVPHIDIAKEMAIMVKEMTDGKFIIKVDSSSKHRAPMGVFDMVKGGQYDMGHSASYYWKGKDIATAPLSSMPFGMTKNQLHAWFKYGGGIELMDKVYSKHGLKSFLGGNTGKQMIWFRKEIKTVEDLKGLKIRMPGFAGEVMHDAGANVINLPAGELYHALETGLIDALEWCAPGTDYKMGFEKIAKFYYIGFHEDSTELQFLVNEGKWNSLPIKYQEILKVAMDKASENFYYKNFKNNAVQWNEFKKTDVKLNRLNGEIIAELKNSNDKLVREFSAQNEEFKEIVDSQREFMKISTEWSYIDNAKY